jgi:hypothetical protein
VKKSLFLGGLFSLTLACLIGLGVKGDSQVVNPVSNPFTLTCATGGGTSCNQATALPVRYTSSSSYTTVCSQYSPAPLAGVIYQVTNIDSADVKLYVSTGVTATTYGFSCRTLGT